MPEEDVSLQAEYQRALDEYVRTHIAGLTLREASLRMGANPAYLSGLLKGAYQLTTAMATKFAETFNADYSELIGLGFEVNFHNPEILGYNPERFSPYYLERAMAAVREVRARESYLKNHPPEDLVPIMVDFKGELIPLSLPKKLADLMLEELQQLLQDMFNDLGGGRTPLPQRPKGSKPQKGK